MKMLKDECHYHTLLLSTPDKKADIRNCVACTQPIIDSSCYSCPHYECDIFVHIFCGELPIETEHGFHQSHTLKLSKAHRDKWCNACRNKYGGLYYSCEECYFDLDLICATLADSKLEHHGHPHPFTHLINLSPRKHLIAPRNPKMLKDMAHNHTLELIPLDKKADIRRCVACNQEIIDNTYYSCPQVGCQHFLHKYCAELPVELKHGFHQTHPLRLTESRRLKRCDACCEEFNIGLYYACDKCKFTLDLICATLADRKLEHPGHPHPLTILTNDIKTFCNCCGEKHQGIFYQCQKCAIFWIHRKCAALGPVVDFAPNHPHPLHFVYSGQEGGSIKCEICRKTVDNHRSWYLQCVPCGFESHVNCAIVERKNEKAEKIRYKKIPRLPWEDCDEQFGSVGLLNWWNSETEVDDEQMKITHFSHPEHELSFHDEVPKVEDQYNGHQMPLSTKCNGCTRKITGCYYSCLDCDFFLHKWCALRRGYIRRQHRNHEYDRDCDHYLVQPNKTWRVEDVFKCSCCEEYCNGFCFECEGQECNYKVDLECAILPKHIFHKSHPFHPLTFGRCEISTCVCCKQKGDYTQVYVCQGEECNFMIHVSCAMFPGKVSHRYDHENLFKLWYDRGAVEANYFYCERCEQYMDAKEWYYHSKSSNGDLLLHPRCILQREDSEMLKFKSTKSFLQVDIHPHRLHLSVLTTIQLYRESCSYCKERFTKLSAEVLRLAEKILCESKGNKKGYTLTRNYLHNEFRDDEDRVRELRSFLDYKLRYRIVLSYNCWEPNCGFKLHSSCAMKLRGENSGVEEYPDENSYVL